MAEKMKRFADACYDKEKRKSLEAEEGLSGTLIEALCFAAWYITHSKLEGNRREMLRKFFLIIEGFKGLIEMD